MDALREIRLLGHPVHSVTRAGAVEHIAREMVSGRGGWVMTPNLDILRRLVTDAGFRELTRAVTLRLADGMPLVWASRLRGTPLPERVAGSDLVSPLCARAEREGYRVYLLGGNPGAAEGAARVLQRRYPHLIIAGDECPPMGFERDERYLSVMRERLRTARPDIVLVALGSPKQERLIAMLREDLPRAWFLGVGISFSFLCGQVRRAPEWMRRAGLEWAHRLAQEPRRLARRYLVSGVPFAARLLALSALEGIRGVKSDRAVLVRPPEGGVRRGAAERELPPSEAA